MAEKVRFASIHDLRQWCADDFRNYVNYRCTRLKFAASEIHLRCAEWLQNGRRFKKIMGWRGCAKTTWFGMEYIGWRFLRKPQTKVIVQCNTDTNAGLTTAGIKRILTNDPLYEHLYPRGQTADRYFNLHNIQPEKGYSIRCAGVETTLTSERADLFLIDDPESADPEALYDRIIEIFEEAQVILYRQGRLFPGEVCPLPERLQRLVLGQPHWEGSAYMPPPPDPNTGELEDHPLRNDDVFLIPAMVNSSFDPDDEIECLSSVPEIRSDEEMRREKESLSMRKWRLNMMLRVEPEDAERAVIPLNHITVRLASPEYIIMVVDPAEGGESEWGLVAGGLYRLNYHLCFMDGITELQVAANEGLDPNHETIGSLMWKYVFDRADDYEVNAIYIEANWAPAIKALRRYLAKHGHTIPVHEFTVHMKKLHRIVMQWEMPVKNGQVSCNPIVMADAQNRKQMSNLRHHRLPKPCDRIDAGGKLLEILSESSVTDTVDILDKLGPPGIADAFGEQDVITASDPLRTRRSVPMRSRASRLRRV